MTFHSQVNERFSEGKMREPTFEAKLLYKALLKRKIKCQLEAEDGHKSVDISIPWAELDIEIDGKHHVYNPNQLYTDIERAHYSKEDGFDTIRIPNQMIKENVNGVADSIAKVARRRYYESKNEETEQGKSIFEEIGDMISSLFGRN